MMKKSFLVLLLLLAACGGGGAGDNQAAPVSTDTSSRAGTRAGTKGPAAGARLAGLYEGGQAPQKNQLCLVEQGGKTQFGLVVWGSNLHSCSGAGEAVRDGSRLRLTMGGDETCTIEAQYRDGNVTLPAAVPTGCAYYCGARASFAGASFARAGDDATQAKDIAGDPLCG